MAKTSVAIPIRNFFEQHLIAQRGLSTHTILAYRDTMKLFLEFVCRRIKKATTALNIEDLTPDAVRRFMEYLERTRNNSIPTRNLRLAAIHSFFQYLAGVDPRYIALSQTIIAVPFKRQTYRVPEYLEKEEVLKIFAKINANTLIGQRDDALLRLLYNTGMRAHELVNLDITHVRFSRPYNVRIYGKGRKERMCPLWDDTVDALKAYLKRRIEPADKDTPLFVNADGKRLTRFGIRYIVTNRAAEAAKVCPSLLTKRVTPHTIRHTTAMHLLQSNVELNMIRSWLGHASIETTNTYVEIDLEMKRKTLKALGKLIPVKKTRTPSWQRSNDILSWLSKI